MRARAESDRLGMVGLATVMANTWFARALSELGQFAEAKARADEGLRVATSADQPFSLIAAHLALGILGLHQGHFHRAAAAFRSAVDLGYTWDIPGYTESAGGLACALALQGRCENAIPVLEEATRTVHPTGVGLLLSGRAAFLGEAARWCGRPHEAEQLAEEALRLARAHKEQGNEAWALRLLGDLTSDREPLDLSAAKTCYGGALALAETLEMRPLAAHCHRGLGLLHRRTGARQVARQELAVARELYRDMGMTFWLERTDSELAEMA
jgi:tetratricopeptide (TPR) repeat protein